MNVTYSGYYFWACMKVKNLYCNDFYMRELRFLHQIFTCIDLRILSTRLNSSCIGDATNVHFVVFLKVSTQFTHCHFNRPRISNVLEACLVYFCDQLVGGLKILPFQAIQFSDSHLNGILKFSLDVTFKFYNCHHRNKYSPVQ